MGRLFDPSEATFPAGQSFVKRRFEPLPPASLDLSVVSVCSTGNVVYVGDYQVTIRASLPDYPNVDIQYVHIEPFVELWNSVQAGQVLGQITRADPLANRVYHLHLGIINRDVPLLEDPDDPRQNDGHYVDPGPFLYP